MEKLEMTASYLHIKESLTEKDIDHQFSALADRLGLSGAGDLIPEVVTALRDDIRLIDALKCAGVNLSKTRAIEQWAFFELVANAKRFAKALTKTSKGYRARVAERVDDLWPVVIRSRSDLRLDTVGRTTVAMCMLAMSYDGQYDGFEATIEAATDHDFDAVKGEYMTEKQLHDSSISLRPGFEPHPDNAQA